MIYTMDQWSKDRTFNAKVGQEVSEEVYNEMLNCMPPKSIPSETAHRALEAYKIPVHAGFLMGEPHDCDAMGQLYLAFGMNDYGKGKHYYYLGLSHAIKPIKDGVYYEYDCMDGLLSGKLWTLDFGEFSSEKAMIANAANHEATLYKYEYKDGERISSVTLYDPYGHYDK